MPDGLTAVQRYFFDVNGYLVLEAVLSTREVDHLNAVLDGHGLAPPGETIASQRFDDRFLEWDRDLRRLLNHRAVLPLLRELLGDHLRLDHAYGITMAPNTDGLGLHGGGTPWDPAQYYLHRGGRPYSGLTTVLWSLVDGRPGDGGFGCIPASHKANERLPGAVPPDWVKEVPVRAGSVLVFTEALTHCTLPWTAPHERRALLFKYSPGSSSWGRYAPPPPSLWQMLSEQQRRLFQPPAVSPHEPV